MILKLLYRRNCEKDGYSPGVGLYRIRYYGSYSDKIVISLFSADLYVMYRTVPLHTNYWGII